MNTATAAFATTLYVLATVSSPVGADEFTFDASEFEKKTFEFSGYLEQKEDVLKLRSGSPAFKLAYPDVAEHDWLRRNTTTLEANGKLNLASVVGDVRWQGVYSNDNFSPSISTATLMDGGLRWSADPSLTFDVGKRVQRWGKGYSWNPVGFIERPKDPADPQAARQGFVMASGEWTKTFSGPISALSVSGFVVPTNYSTNSDFGKDTAVNPAAKLYLLALDTDIDLLWLGKGARPQSFGFDFSRNLSTALEVHGEWARTLDAPQKIINAAGVVSGGIRDFNTYLLGLRYLTQGEVTWVGEYYHNGGGYSADELDDYYQFLDSALASNAGPSLVAKALEMAQSGYGKSNPGRDYIYLKASASEPLGWVYGAAQMTAIANLNDGSYQITPEITYTGFSNVELRARVIFLGGQPDSEFTQKASSSRLEVYARFFF